MFDLEEFNKFQDFYLLDLIDIYFDINQYCKNNAFDILNSDNNNKNKDFIDLIYRNVYVPKEDLNDDEESDSEDFILIK